jgi:hypothetical protein
MSRGDGAGEFERWLDRELGRAIASEVGAGAPPPRPVGAASGRRFGGSGVRGFGARSGAVVFAAALAVASGGAALATGSPNPVTWGQDVVQVVSTGPMVHEHPPIPTTEAPAGPGSPPTAPVEQGALATASPGDDQSGNGQSDGNAGKERQQGHGQGHPTPTHRAQGASTHQ